MYHTGNNEQNIVSENGWESRRNSGSLYFRFTTIVSENGWESRRNAVQASVQGETIVSENGWESRRNLGFPLFFGKGLYQKMVGSQDVTQQKET